MLSLCCHANSWLLGAAAGMNTFPVNSEMVQHHCSHTRAHSAYIRHRGANSDATTWSYRAPMMINKQHFGWKKCLWAQGGGRGRETEREAVLDTDNLGALKWKHEISVLLKYTVCLKTGLSQIQAVWKRLMQEWSRRWERSEKRGRGKGGTMEDRKRPKEEKNTHRECDK